MENNEIQKIKTLKILCIIGLFVPFMNLITTPMLYYKLKKNTPQTVLVCFGLFIPFLGLCLIFITLGKASDAIKMLHEDANPPIEYTEQELSEYEDKVSIDEEVLKRYLSYKQK